MDRFITSDPATLDLLDVLDRVADTDASVLITGESGTGKELLARGIHEASSRSKHAWVAMNCGAVPVGLHESELFGHVAGAFTGASQSKPGRFATADGGTIFLDEVGEMPKPMQTGLLRVLQSGEFSPIGEAKTTNCDVRVVSATNRDLPVLVSDGRFRLDLYHRLNLIEIKVPALRHRRADIPLLANHFLEKYATRYQRRVSIGESFFDALLERTLPGNARELENIVRRAVLVCRTSCLGRNDLPPEKPSQAAEPADPPPTERTFHEEKAKVIAEFERQFLTSILRKNAGIVRHAATACGLSERNFHAKLAQYRITSKDFRGAGTH
ncbi:MAG: sigma-54 interaction domain-containing protein [Planctomycetota bacterium]